MPSFHEGLLFMKVSRSPDNKSVVSNFKRLPVVVCLCSGVLLVLVVLWYYSAFIYAHPVTSASQLEGLLGKRVTLQGVYDDSFKEYTLIYFDQTTIRFSYVTGARNWSPKTREKVTVVGILDKTPWVQDIPLIIREGGCYPISN